MKQYLFGISLMIFCSLCNAQSETKKQCEPPSIVFKNFQKHNINIVAGVAVIKVKSEGENHHGYGAAANINFLLANYLETGFCLRPYYIKYVGKQRTLLLEQSVYLKYYYWKMVCRKALFSASVGILKDGSIYNAKGETINGAKKFIYVSPIDFTLLAGKWGRIDGNTEIFLNNRPVKFNLSLLFNIHNVKL